MRTNSLFVGSMVASQAEVSRLWRQAQSRAADRCKLPVIVFDADDDDDLGRLVLIREADIGRLAADLDCVSGVN